MQEELVRSREECVWFREAGVACVLDVPVDMTFRPLGMWI